MKNLIITSLVAVGIASTAFGQGFVTFSGGGIAATRVSTNSVAGGASAGLTSATANLYYYALFASTTQTASAGNGTTATYAFNNQGSVSTAWELVGIGANIASVGRFTATSQGTTSAGQLALNGDNSLTVQGIGGGGNANFVAIGWSANIGTTLASVMSWYNSGAPQTVGWIGQSSTSVGITLGDGGTIATPSWNSTGSSFLLGTVNVAPIPEPSTLVLAGLGGLSLLAFRRKK